MNGLGTIALFSFAMIVGCHQAQTRVIVFHNEETEVDIAELRAVYAAFNRGYINRAVRFLDSQIEWAERAEFPGGGTYHGVDGAKQYFTQSGPSRPK